MSGATSSAGREPANQDDLNVQMRWWIAEIANQHVHGTTREQVMARWEADRAAMHPVNGRSPYPYMDDEQRKVARDAYVSWKGSRYPVPWHYAGKEVWVRDHGPSVEIRYSAERIAVHAPATRRHQVVTLSHHHVGIPTHSRGACSGSTYPRTVSGISQVCSVRDLSGLYLAPLKPTLA